METALLEQDARRIAAAAIGIPGVVAVSLGGSLANRLADQQSDIDLHVYWQANLASQSSRAAILATVADPASAVVEISDWGLEDHLQVHGVLAELIYVNLGDLQADLERAYGEGLAGEGFTTAQFAYIANGIPLEDPQALLHSVRQRLVIYPEATRQRIIQSHAGLLSAYLGQFQKAQSRGDLLFVQHRRYTIQMVFFNLLFALNRYYHPGEKRLIEHGLRCQIRPAALRERWEYLAILPADDSALADGLEELISDLCRLTEGAHP